MRDISIKEAFFISALWLSVGYMIGYTVHGDEVVNPTPCEEMYEFNWSFQQCLKHGATCANQIDIAGFGKYHQNRHALTERCDDQLGTVLPENANEVLRK